MVNDRELAEIIVEGIFTALNSGNLECWRIQGKAMGNDQKERDLGGFSKTPLTDHVEAILKEHRSY